MRILRILLTILAVGMALFVAPWALVPIAVGLIGGAVVLFEVSKRPWMQKAVLYFKTAAVVAALAVTTWFVIGTPLKPEQVSIGSRVNQAVRGVVHDASVAPRLAQSQADLDRLNLREALQNERRKLALISKALYLNEAASKTRMRQTTIGGADEKLSGALDKF